MVCGALLLAGPHKPVTFAIEGAVPIAGQSVRWLRDNLEFFKEAKDIGKIDNYLGGVWLGNIQGYKL